MFRNPTTIVYSEEQKAIATALKDGYNVMTDSVAGSGKTTSIRHIVEELSFVESSDDNVDDITGGEPITRNILVLLYNKRLADETNAKIKSSNTKIGTIHSLAQMLYGVMCRNDDGIKAILDTNMPLVDPSSNYYDIIIVDEVQDVTLLLARIILKIIKDCQPLNLVFMGDYKQCIYKFMQADERYLTMADTIFGPSIMDNTYLVDSGVKNDKWVRLKLSQTFRCTKPMVDFVNHCMLKEERMVSNRQSFNKPYYIVCKIFKIADDINNMIDDYIKQGNKQHDIAILAQSVKNPKAPVSVISNYLSSKGKLIDKRDDNVAVIDNKSSDGKIVVSTFHSFKGLERKMIIIIGFDASFYLAAKDESKDVCPNVLYVACTRAKERLIMFQDEDKGPLPFLNLELLPKYANLVGDPKVTILPEERPKIKSYSATELIKFLPYTLYDELKALWSELVINDLKSDTINLDMIIPFTQKSSGIDYYENISSIYGCAIPMLKKFELDSETTLYQLLTQHENAIKDLGITNHVHPLMYEREKLLRSDKIQNDNDNNSDSKDKNVSNGGMKNMYKKRFPKLINIYQCIMDRYIHPLNQVINYDWYFTPNTQSGINKGVKRLNFVGKDDVFEKPVSYSTRVKVIDETYVDVTINGAIDCISKRYGPLEFKFVNDFDSNHKLQVIVYACLLYLSNKVTDDFHLFNIRTGDMIKIHVDNIQVNAEIILNKIIKHKLLTCQQSMDLSEIMSKLKL